MTHRIVPPIDRATAAAEYRDIHFAVCRYRRQGLVCSNCSDLAERAVRASASVLQIARVA